MPDEAAAEASWAPRGTCFFCQKPAGNSERRTCPFHRPLEASAVTEAAEMLTHCAEQLPPEDGDWMRALMSWRDSEAAQALMMQADPYEMPGMTVGAGLMLMGLTARVAEDWFGTASRPSVDALRLTIAERDQLVREHLDRVLIECGQTGARFSKDSVGTGTATYKVAGRRALRRFVLRQRVTVSDLGVTTVDRL